jgi:hypothetical protein
MSLFRNDDNVETVQNGCPICHSDVKGNDLYLYYCVHCNILFKKDDLVLDKIVIDKLLKEKVAEKFDKEKDKIKIEQDLLKEKELTDKKKELLKDLKEAKKYYISKKSNILHVGNCPYGKNIKKENKIILRSLEGTVELKRCRCMTEQ